ncbi:MAG: alanine/ornithine racemase family PLP-dependent enzyme, partial [Nitriliruptor sp.]
ARAVEAARGVTRVVVSGGNSANLGWALGPGTVGRIDDLRIGEAILLGHDPLDRRPIAGLRTDAFTIVAEVIESRIKPSLPWGRTAQTAFGEPVAAVDIGSRAQTILALGQQDTDPLGLEPPTGTTILGASSDHLIVTSDSSVSVGAELRFRPNYSALLRAMTSPTVAKVFVPSPDLSTAGSPAG